MAEATEFSPLGALDIAGFYREWIAEAPDELVTLVTNRKAPPLPFVPRELHGKLVVGVACCYAGPLEEGEKVVRPLKEFGSPVLDLCVPKPYLATISPAPRETPSAWRLPPSPGSSADPKLHANSMPAIREEFSASETQVVWIATGFMLVMATGSRSTDATRTSSIASQASGSAPQPPAAP